MLMSVHKVIEELRDIPDNLERGVKFEELMVEYFTLDPMMSQEYDAVWRWRDWPGAPSKKDTGIDLVARERDSGDLTAVQCKFYDPLHTLTKGDIDSFFTESGKEPFTNRLIISTTDRWSKHAEQAMQGQTKPVARLGLADIADSPIEWSVARPAGAEVLFTLSPARRHGLRRHQQVAVDRVFEGYGAGFDRGRLVMACGTGKTFTGLKIAERTAAEIGDAARILFCVPSISLLSQTMREWTAQSQLELRAFAVCSDGGVGRASEDYRVHDIAIPVTTQSDRLASELSYRNGAPGLTVVFTTYQSLPVVAEAQQNHGAAAFDLVLCDEAHRTTGVTLAGADESNFVRVHDAAYVKAARRLYMTATPRIYAEDAKDQATQAAAVVASMDDEEIFGPEFHRLSFGEAVDENLLTDYKVLVLTVDESVIAEPLQRQLAAEHGELNLDDASKIIGCWNGLAKRCGQNPDGAIGFEPGEAPMRRAVAFARDIADSKQVESAFPDVVDAYRELLTGKTLTAPEGATDGTNLNLRCEIHHVDGTMSALERNRELNWLKEEVAADECRILTNVRCLSEGVDVPALDAVMFLQPRNSVVDVVQSVGRVMRRSEGKKYGYIILPVAVPAGVEPSAALSDNRRFRVVWQVLNALRAHDDRFNAMVNSIALNGGNSNLLQGTDKLFGGHIGPLDPADESIADGDQSDAGVSGSGLRQLALFTLAQWQEAIFARIVDKVGTRVYWEQWAADVADIATAQITRIKAILTGADPQVAQAFDSFLAGLRDNLNESITADDAISMLSQHLITKPVFDALFAEHDFASQNPVSAVMQAMVDTLDGAGLEAETAKLAGFYNSVRRRAAEVTGADGKQKIISELYEKFFRLGFKKQADALGIVYTPVEVIDFILSAADAVLHREFGRGLTDENVHILDPFTGTGTFIARLLQSGRITAADMARKYANELHANEIMLLAYYIAAVNIETTYHALMGKTENRNAYKPFPGIVLADTFQIGESGDTFDEVVFPQNNERIARQKATKINVIIGNPPYSVGQDSANDMNANVKYRTVDRRITDTYAALSTARNKNSLYDSYLRAFRWATDRIGNAGVVAYVSNGGWIDGNTADGIRLSLAQEYSRIHVYNLRGNQRTAGELSRREGGKIFGSGSRNTVAIFIGVKQPNYQGRCEIHYHDIGDYLSREEKLRILAEQPFPDVDWQVIAPNNKGDWINHRDNEFQSWPAIGNKKPEAGIVTVFGTFSAGLKTGRDAWCCSFSKERLTENIENLLDQYMQALKELREQRRAAGVSTANEALVTAYLQSRPSLTAPGCISWNRGLRQDLARDTEIGWSDSAVRVGTYRPFQPQWTYLNRRVNDMIYQLPSMFPTPHHNNLGIVITGAASHFEFTPFITDLLPNLHTLDTAQFFPRWTYEKIETTEGELDLQALVTDDVDDWGYRRVDNITDEILANYRYAADESITKDDIFYYVYGVLHDPTYRASYAADLRKMLPHIPTPQSAERFALLRDAGKTLADLHIGYESAPPYPLDVQVKPTADQSDRETWRVRKMKWRSTDDRTAIIYNPNVTIAGIPTDAQNYILGSRSALDWIIDRYQLRVDKASGIVNDPNDWCDDQNSPTWIIDLIKRVTTVSLETMRIVDQLAENPVRAE
ncbi:DEAD/DEAH box helicase [Nocardia sp. NPDC048505]|uniref:DEAD/DEAH box helicase n=1 Tax=unclassified Nocardia TaxID=2637762 RepID=UPI0033FB2D49